MKKAKKPAFWESTRLQGLVRRHNGIYYARSFIGRREKWKSLRTTLFSVAEARLADHQREGREHRALTDATETGDLTFGQAVDLYLRRLRMDADRKPSTKHYHEQVITSILRDWPNLQKRELRRITRIDCIDWAERHGTRTSATRFNAALGIFRAVLNIGIEHGAIVISPAGSLKRRAVRAKRAELPSREKFLEMLEVIRSGGARFSRACTDFVAGLAFTGLRLGEARHLLWSDIDFERGLIHVRGDAKTATKNWETRYVPLITDAEQLFAKMRGEYPDTSPEQLVFLVREAQKSLDRAATKIGGARITHHSLRHLFATICIESGVDIPTVSRWLGHKDGGALAMRVYGHLRQEHSIAAATKVNFAVVKAADKRAI